MSWWCTVFGHSYDEDDVCTRCGSVPGHLARAFRVFGGPEALKQYIQEYERDRRDTIYDSTFVFAAEGHPDNGRDLFAVNAVSYSDASDIVEEKRPAGVKVYYVGELNELVDNDRLGELALQRAGYDLTEGDE